MKLRRQAKYIYKLDDGDFLWIIWSLEEQWRHAANCAVVCRVAMFPSANTYWEKERDFTKISNKMEEKVLVD